jgi:hypothetical protein
MYGEDLNSPRSSAVQTTEHIEQFNLGDEIQSDEDEEWGPGDGICPSTSQFHMCYKAHFNNWRMAALTRPERSRSISFYIEAFLNLLKDVPPFFTALRKASQSQVEPGLHLSCGLLYNSKRHMIQTAIRVRRILIIFSALDFQRPQSTGQRLKDNYTPPFPFPPLPSVPRILRILF